MFFITETVSVNRNTANAYNSVADALIVLRIAAKLA